MSAPPHGGAARCACTNISLIQLFHELKQKFPAAPDHAVSAAISVYCHDKRACEEHLERQAAASLAHAYHASSSAAARRLKDLSEAVAPVECRNRVVETQFPITSDVREFTCDRPQNAKLSDVTLDDNRNIELVEAINEIEINDRGDEINANIESVKVTHSSNADSPITINIDNCLEKSGEFSSDLEAEESTKVDVADETGCHSNNSTESENYRIHKSHKVISDLNVKLEKTKEKKVITKQSDEPVQAGEQSQVNIDKPKRPCTLEFLKPQGETTPTKNRDEPSVKFTNAISPVDRNESHKEQLNLWQDQYPLNLSVNVNCHMDIANRPHVFYPNSWLDDYESPRAFTSVNLTVCTPTSGGMQSPGRELSGEGRGFEGHLTVTVSPSSSRPRRAAPPPPHVPQATTPQNHVATRVHHTTAVPESSLIARQLARKRRLEEELERERERLARMTRETAVLAAPLPAPAAAATLRDQVEWLRTQCRAMTQRLDLCNSAHQRDREDVVSYPRGSRSPTPHRPAPPPPDDAPSWRCQVCTFSNHGLLDKCEQCEMPRILVGTHQRRVSQTKLDSTVLLGSAHNPPNPACV